MIARLRASKPARRREISPFPKEVTERTDRLVEIADHCAAARQTAEAMGEDFIAYLLAMAEQEPAAAMSRAKAGAPPPAKARRRPKSSA